MATLDSTSTLTEALAAYRDNAGYEEDADVTMAKAFVTACRFLLSYPKMSGKGGNQIVNNPDKLESEMDSARAYVRANDTSSSTAGGARVIHPSFANFRS